MTSLAGEEVDYEAVYRDAQRAFERARRARGKARARVRRNPSLQRNTEKEMAFCRARHAMMMALVNLEGGVAAALLQKARYMNRAKLPVTLQFDEVLHYIDCSHRVHLFFGGGVAPTGVGFSPDGVGHGHVVLAERGGGDYKIVFRRRPGA